MRSSKQDLLEDLRFVMEMKDEEMYTRWAVVGKVIPEGTALA